MIAGTGWALFFFQAWWTLREVRRRRRAEESELEAQGVTMRFLSNFEAPESNVIWWRLLEQAAARGTDRVSEPVPGQSCDPSKSEAATISDLLGQVAARTDCDSKPEPERS